MAPTARPSTVSGQNWWYSAEIGDPPDRANVVLFRSTTPEAWWIRKVRWRVRRLRSSHRGQAFDDAALHLVGVDRDGPGQLALVVELQRLAEALVVGLGVQVVIDRLAGGGAVLDGLELGVGAVVGLDRVQADVGVERGLVIGLELGAALHLVDRRGRGQQDGALGCRTSGLHEARILRTVRGDEGTGDPAVLELLG